MNEAKSIEDYLKHFKNITNKLKTDGFNEFHLRKLIEIYFKIHGKHQLKNSIQIFFNHLPENEEQAMHVVTNQLTQQIEYYRNAPFDERFNLVSFINDLSQNFRIAIRAIAIQADAVLGFLKTIIKYFNEHIQLEASPTKKIELSHRLHNSFQAYIFCLKSHMNEQGDRCLEAVDKEFSEIIVICMNILDRDDGVSVETKNICAMLIVMRNLVCLKNSSHLEFISNEKESAVKRLCITFGVIQIMNQNVDIALLDYLCSTMEKIYSTNSTDRSIIFAVSRSISLLTKKIVASSANEYCLHLQSITRSIMSVAFLNLEHYIESVRHYSRDSLRNIVEIGMKINDKERLMLKEIFQKINSISSVCLQAIVVHAIYSALPISEIIRRMPLFLVSLLKSIGLNKEHKLSCYKLLANESHKENVFDEWFNHFIQPIIEILKCCNRNDDDYMLLKNLILKCIMIDKKAIKILLDSIQNDIDIEFYLSCLSIAKMENALENVPSTETIWKGVITFDDIKKFMLNVDFDINISALQLIVETKKTTIKFTAQEIECVLFFFEMNINVQNPSTRQSIMSMIKKLFIRLHGIVQAISKRNEKEEQMQEQFHTLMKFHEFCLKNLDEKAKTNYSTRSFSLNILLHVVVILDEFFQAETQNIWTNDDFKKLLNIFYDTFETNKEIALTIMEYLPQIRKKSSISMEYLKTMTSSIRPADSLSAAYLMKFSLLSNQLLPSLDNCSDICSEAFKLLIWCENQLLKALSVALKSIIVASSTDPMYGWLLSMRFIISTLDLNDLKNCPKWRDFFSRLITTSRKLSTCVEHIINDDAPEGMVPKENLNEIFIGKEEETARIIENTTPQMILLCAWRSIKEVSLLLGDISIRSSITHDATLGLIDVKQMQDIGDQFLDFLCNVKHRGAFEQSFSGYSQYCIALRMCNADELHNLPSRILQNIIDMISGEEIDDNDGDDLIKIKINLCSTRRSAGLPFIVQALLTSELKISQSVDFHFVMKKLINFARCGRQLETRIHSLNILRALFRCKEFNDTITEYIGAGLKCALLGYNDTSYSLRNSCTLLFTAIIVRTFGVQRNKNDHDINIKNKMSGKVFFSRYPGLYDFFMNQFKDAIECVKQQKMNSKLHPLLLLLNRLYTDGSENSQLIQFLPIVTMCSPCVELQTRILCAKFIANVIQPNSSMPRIIENIRSVRDDNLIANAKHGKILEILYLLRNPTALDNHHDDGLKVLNEILDLLKIFKLQLIIFASVLDIIMEILQRITLKDEKLIKKLEICFDFDKQSLIGISMLQSKLIVIDLIRRKTNFITDIKINMRSFEILEKLNCIILILNHENISELAAEYEINSKIQHFVKNYECLEEFKDEIKNDENLKLELMKIAELNDANVSSRSYEILSCLNYKCGGKNSVEKIVTLVSQLENKSENLSKSILKYIDHCVKNEPHLISAIEWDFLPRLLSSSSMVK